ncbi:MAG: CvpA family protein [Alistipes sp.]|nr:CvpA family protein [Candidatus Minthomonas equi]
MAAIDIIIIIFLCVCIFVGAKNGIVRQLGGIVGLFLGLYLAYRCSPAFSGFIVKWVKLSDSVAKIISFVLILVATLLLTSLISRLLESVFAAVAVNWINRLLGIILSMAVGILLVGVLLHILKYVNQNWFPDAGGNWMSDSKLAGPILKAVDKLFPYLKQLF